MGKTTVKKKKIAWIQTITSVLFIIVILLCLPLVVPRFFGVTPYNVISGSMTPEIPVGSVVYARQVPIDQLEVGDIIVFQGVIADSGLVTHRIIEVDDVNRQFRTKGDANSSADVNPVEFHRVLGQVVFHLPFLGAISELLFAGNHKLVLLAIFVLALVLCLFEAVLGKVKPDKKEGEILEESQVADTPAKKKKSYVLDYVIIVFALLLIIGGGLGFFLYQKNYSDSNELYTELEDTYVSYQVPVDKNDDAVVEDLSWDTLLDVDFKELMTANPETCGWLYLENEDLSYPIMYSGDNDKYLRTGFNGKEATAGSIFLEGENRFDFSDSHTIIYGHNMRNLSMFGKLKFYHQKDDYYENHKYFQILTPVVKYRYEIFAYEDVAEDSFIYAVPFGDNAEFGDFLKNIQRISQKDTGVSVSQADHVVTLSTCSTTGRRFVVHGVLVDVSIMNKQE